MRFCSVPTIQIEQAQTHLAELIEHLVDGQEVVIAKGAIPVARLLPAQTPEGPTFGSARGKIVFQKGWNEPAPGFEDYR